MNYLIILLIIIIFILLFYLIDYMNSNSSIKMFSREIYKSKNYFYKPFQYENY